MTLGLRPGLSFCTINERIIFLDVPADRYFCLNSGMEDMFRAWACAACPGDCDQAELADLCHRGVLVEGGSIDVSPPAVQTPTWVQDGSSFSGAFIVDGARAIWTRRIISGNLDTGGFARALKSLRCAKDTGASTSSSRSRSNMARIANAHRVADLIWGAHNKCLLRALALGHDLMVHGHECQFVIGVALRPFQAHCWVQAVACLLNDDLETIRNFKPILVI